MFDKLHCKPQENTRCPLTNSDDACVLVQQARNQKLDSYKHASTRRLELVSRVY